MQKIPRNSNFPSLVSIVRPIPQRTLTSQNLTRPSPIPLKPASKAKKLPSSGTNFKISKISRLGSVKKYPENNKSNKKNGLFEKLCRFYRNLYRMKGNREKKERKDIRRKYSQNINNSLSNF